MPNIPSAFSVSRCARKKPPRSYTSSLYNSAVTIASSQPRPVFTFERMFSKFAFQDFPPILTWSAEICHTLRTDVSTMVASPLP